jgi:hypothetical protein
VTVSLLICVIVLLLWIEWQVLGIEGSLYRIIHKENIVMDELQDVMAVVTAQTTLVGSVVEFIKGLPDNAVDPVAKQAILDALKANDAALEAAIAANVTP